MGSSLCGFLAKLLRPKGRGLYRRRKRLWKSLHPDSDIHLSNLVSIKEDFLRSIQIGKFSYGDITILQYGKDERLTIGNCVSLANTKFLLGGNHRYDGLSTFPFCVKMLGEEESPQTGKGPIVVEDDVWIGEDSLILSGVTIGRGAVVAARSVVTINVTPYSIVGGNPACFIKWRFPENVRAKLMEFDFSKIDLQWIKDNKDVFSHAITEHNIDGLIAKIKEVP